MNVLHGKHIKLRLVDLDDAAFILSLRLNDDRNKYLSQVSSDLEKQIDWIREYKNRERQKLEYYYIVQDKSEEALGTVRIYDLRENSFSWGSWILKPDAPIYAAIESALCVYQFGFEVLGYSQSHFEVRKENLKVNMFHRGLGAILDSDDELNYYYHLPIENFSTMKNRYHKYLL